MAKSGTVGRFVGLKFQNTPPNARFGDFFGRLWSFLWQLRLDRQIMRAYPHLGVSGTNTDYFAVGKGIR